MELPRSFPAFASDTSGPRSITPCVPTAREANDDPLPGITVDGVTGPGIDVLYSRWPWSTPEPERAGRVMEGFDSSRRSENSKGERMYI